jgi:hypothetical protein
VQLNTAVRPAAEQGVEPVDARALATIARQIGNGCEVIADVPATRSDRRGQRIGADVLSMLKRRPCSVQDLCTGLGISAEEAMRQVTNLRSQGLIVGEPRGDTVYFEPIQTLLICPQTPPSIGNQSRIGVYANTLFHPRKTDAPLADKSGVTFEQSRIYDGV